MELLPRLAIRVRFPRPLQRVPGSDGSLESFPFLSVSSNINAPGGLVIMEARTSPWMEQHRTPPLPTAMAWDRNGELCREEMGRVMAQLDVPRQKVAPKVGLRQQEPELARY